MQHQVEGQLAGRTRRSRRTLRVITMLSLVIVSTATACSGASKESGTGPTAPGTEITALVVSSPSASAMQALAPEFTKKTGIKVNFVMTDYNTSATKVLLANRSHQANYDVFQVDKPFFPQLGNAGALTPLDQRLKDDTEYDLSDFSAQIQEYQKYQGKTYGLALSTEPFVLWYRTDLFKKAQLAPPKTWKEYATRAASLQSSKVWGSAFDYGASQSAKYWAAMLYESGGRILDPKTMQPQLTSDVAERAMQMYINLAKETPPLAINGDTGAGAGQVVAFEQLDVAQMVQNSGWYSDLNDPSKSKAVGKFAAAPMPQSSDGPYPTRNLLYGWQLAIPTDSQKKDAAWQFMTYVLAKSNVGAFIDAGAPPPGRTSTASNPKYLEKLPYLKVMLSEASNAEALPGVPDIAEIIAEISKQISAMVSGQVSVSEGLQRAQSAVTVVLKRDKIIS